MKDFSAVTSWIFLIRYCIRYYREWKLFWSEYENTKNNLEKLKKEETEKLKKEETEKLGKLEEELAKLKEENENSKKKK